MISAERIANSVKRLPVLPMVSAKLSQALSDEKTTPAQIEGIIQVDAALTATFLRIANSSYFATRGKIGSIRQAVVQLGRRRVMQLAVTSAFSRVMPKTIPGYGLDAATFWQHTIAVAVLSERLAKELGRTCGETAFTAGLLHDIGKLVIGAFLAEEMVEVTSHIRRGDAPLVVIEREVLGTDHCQVGGTVATRWNLPDELVAVARFHHSPNEAPAGPTQELVDIVHAADLLSYIAGYGADVGELLRSPDPTAIKRLGLKTQKLERVACETMTDIQEIAGMFTGNAKDKP